MDFALDEELVMVRDAAREFADNELVPRASRHDRQEALDEEIYGLLAELGMWGLSIPESYGGSDLGNLALVTVLEELNRGCASTGVTVSVHNSLVVSPINRFAESSVTTPVTRFSTASSALFRGRDTMTSFGQPSVGQSDSLTASK